MKPGDHVIPCYQVFYRDVTKDCSDTPRDVLLTVSLLLLVFPLQNYVKAWRGLQAFCGECGMCKSQKTNLCGSVRNWTGKGIMRADSQPRFTHKETGKKIFHFVSHPSLTV